MNFDKNAMLRKLTYLEMKIEYAREQYLRNANDPTDDESIANMFRAGKCRDDLAFVRGLMDDIECGRITEFPLVEKTNYMTDKTYLEDPDTPRSCSPSTELFWTM